MRVRAKVDEKQLLAKMKQYGKICGKTVAQTLRNHSRLLALELMKLTAPPQLGGAGAAAAKAKATTAVWRDVGYTMLGLNSVWNARWEAFQNKKRKSERRFYTKKGRIWLTDSFRFVGSAAAAIAHHEAERQRGPGKYKPPQRRSPYDGRWKAMHMVVMQKSVLAAARKKIAEKIGYAKSGWADAAQACRADTKAAAKLSGIPAWVRRNMGKAGGTAHDMTEGWWNAAGNPRVRLSSGVKHMDKMLSRNQIRGRVDFVRYKYIKFLQAAIRADIKNQKRGKG